MVKKIDEILSDNEYIDIVGSILREKKVKQMKRYRQHHNVNCLEHCLYVSYNTYLICKKLNLDYRSAARAGLLHDLFLYDWRKRENGRKGFHAFTHPKEAFKQASSIINLNEIEKDIILKHMWPVTLALPKYKETYIITYVDKYFAVAEYFIKCQHRKIICKKIVTKSKLINKKGAYNI